MRTEEKTFRNIHGKVLRVQVDTFSDNTITILVENTESSRERRKFLKLTVITGSLYVILGLFNRVFGSIFGHISMLFLTLIPFYLFLNVIESESVTFVRHFALQNTRKYSSGRVENRLIPTKSIHDIVINEVIQRQRVIFMLQVLLQQETRTKERIFSLFEKSKPNLLCLEFIYSLLYKRWENS